MHPCPSARPHSSPWPGALTRRRQAASFGNTPTTLVQRRLLVDALQGIDGAQPLPVAVGAYCAMVQASNARASARRGAVKMARMSAATSACISYSPASAPLPCPAPPSPASTRAKASPARPARSRPPASASVKARALRSPFSRAADQSPLHALG